jgi:hypothetical protein
MEVFTRIMPRHILFGKCCPYSPKRKISPKKKRVKKNLTHPISWNGQAFNLLLVVLGPPVEGGDDMTERVALRGAIISRVDFLANAMAAEDMNLEERYSSWRTACVLPALEGHELDAATR